LKNPVGPQAWRGFSLFLVDLASSHFARLSPFLALSRSLFSICCERAKSRVRKISPLQIKGLAKFWDRQFFRASLGQSTVWKNGKAESLRISTQARLLENLHRARSLGAHPVGGQARDRHIGRNATCRFPGLGAGCDGAETGRCRLALGMGQLLSGLGHMGTRGQARNSIDPDKKRNPPILAN